MSRSIAGAECQIRSDSLAARYRPVHCDLTRASAAAYTLCPSAGRYSNLAHRQQGKQRRTPPRKQPLTHRRHRRSFTVKKSSSAVRFEHCRRACRCCLSERIHAQGRKNGQCRLRCSTSVTRYSGISGRMPSCAERSKQLAERVHLVVVLQQLGGRAVPHDGCPQAEPHIVSNGKDSPPAEECSRNRIPRLKAAPVHGSKYRSLRQDTAQVTQCVRHIGSKVADR